MKFLILLAILLQDPSHAIKQIDGQLAKGSTTVSAVLANPSYTSLHSVSAFREVIKKHAKALPLNIVTSSEPGIQATIKVQLLNANAPARNTLVYVFQTDHRGLYFGNNREGGGMDARLQSRLFGYVRTNEKGEFELHTIRPASYPGTSIPQHIHLEAFDANGNSLHITELLFDDDPELTGSTRQQYLNQGYVIGRNKGTKDKQVFEYVVKVKP